MSVWSFIKQNPDWPVTLWLNTPEKELDVVLTHEQKNITEEGDIDYMLLLQTMGVEVKQIALAGFDGVSPCHKGDFFKWMLMGADGGYYLDMDILFIKPMDSLVETLEKDGYDTVLGFYRFYQIGILASAPQNPFFHDVLRLAHKAYSAGDYNSSGVVAFRDAYKTPNDIEKSFPCKVYNMPKSMFYPLGAGGHSGEIAHLFESELDFGIRPDTIGIHWFAGSPISQKWIRVLDCNSYKKYNTMFCKWLGRVIG
ncbi:MAG: glycosyltransferase [Balneolaceae bacterium]